MAVEIINYLAGENGVTEKIKKAMYDAARQFVYIGFLLQEVKDYQYYVTGGYKDVYDYAEQELGFKKSSTKNFIAVAETFGSRKENGQVFQTMSLQQEYKNFKYSQLVEMLAMSDGKRKQVTPDMTIKQIREIKKEPEFKLTPEYETMQLELPESSRPNQEPEPADKGQTSGRQLEYTIVLNRADWELIIEQLEDNIKYNYGDPGEIESLTQIVDLIKGTIKHT